MGHHQLRTSGAHLSEAAARQGQPSHPCELLTHYPESTSRTVGFEEKVIEGKFTAQRVLWVGSQMPWVALSLRLRHPISSGQLGWLSWGSSPGLRLCEPIAVTAASLLERQRKAHRRSPSRCFLPTCLPCATGDPLTLTSPESLNSNVPSACAKVPGFHGLFFQIHASDEHNPASPFPDHHRVHPSPLS